MYALAFSPDSRLLASGGDDGSIKIWNVESGATVYTLSGHKGKVNLLSFDKYGEKLTSVGSDKRLKRWNLTDRREILNTEIKDANELGAVSATKYGDLIAVGIKMIYYTSGLRGIKEKEFYRVYNDSFVEQRIIGEEYKKIFFFSALSPEGYVLATSGYDQGIWLWDVMHGKDIAKISDPGRMRSVAFGPGRDSYLWLAAAGDGSNIKTWALQKRFNQECIQNKPVLAVLPFIEKEKDVVGENVLSALTGVAQEEVASTNLFTMISRSKMDQVMKEQMMEDLGMCTDKACHVEHGKIFQAEQIIVGTVSKVGSAYNISLDWIDVATSDLLGAGNEWIKTDVEAELIFVTQRIVKKLLQ